MQERDARMSALEMRQRVDAVVPSMLAFVEQTSDRVRAEAREPAVRRRALLLKIDVLPVVYRAAFQTDPLAAALDLWLLSYQLEDCLEAGRGPCDFGSQQPIAREAARAQRVELEELFARLTMNPEATARDRDLVRATARRYPLQEEGSIRRRRTMTEELLKAMDVQGVGAFDVIGDVSTTLANLTSRLNLYLGDATRLGRWHAELLVGDLAEELAHGTQLERVLGDLDRVTDSVESAATTLRPDALNALMERPLGLVSDERRALLADVERQRVLTLDHLTAERRALVEDLLRGVEAERVATLAQIRQERLETLVELERLRRATIADAGAEGIRLVDHLFWRLIQLLVGLLLLAGFVGWALLRTARRQKYA